MKRKKSKLYWLAGLLVISCIGGVFAYWTQELLVHNEFQTARYDTSIEEEFVSPEDWKPGQEVNKDVWIENNGTVPVFIKVVLRQEWIRRENVTDLDGSIILPAAGEEFPLVFEAEKGEAYAAQIAWGDQVVLLKNGKTSSIDLGLEVVETIGEAAGKWLMINDKPDEKGEYLFYYIGYVDANSKSPLLIDQVTMNPFIQPAVLRKDTYYDEETKQWITKSKKNPTYDYECARYTLTVDAMTVQATKGAVQKVFGSEKDHAETVSYLAEIAPNLKK